MWSEQLPHECSDAWYFMGECVLYGIRTLFTLRKHFSADYSVSMEHKDKPLRTHLKQKYPDYTDEQRQQAHDNLMDLAAFIVQSNISRKNTTPLTEIPANPNMKGISSKSDV